MYIACLHHHHPSPLATKAHIRCWRADMKTAPSKRRAETTQRLVCLQHPLSPHTCPPSATPSPQNLLSTPPTCPCCAHPGTPTEQQQHQHLAAPTYIHLCLSTFPSSAVPEQRAHSTLTRQSPAAGRFSPPVGALLLLFLSTVNRERWTVRSRGVAYT